MNTLKGLVVLLFSFILTFLFVIPSSVSEEAIVFELPTIPSGTPEYDKMHPENLIEDQLIARSAILIEADSGEVIFSKHPDEIMYPASTTKIMTIYLALIMGNTNDVVTINQEAPAGSSTAKFKVGEEVNMLDLLYATMIMSANEGAIAIAEHIAGSESAFVELMNQTAAYMGCTSTHFANSHGLHDYNHYTSARDMAIIAREAMNNELFKQICAATTYQIGKTNMQKARSVTGATYYLMSTEDNSDQYYRYGTGIKTGYTAAAGYCFVGSASKEGVNLISVVLYSGQKNRYLDTAKLMDYGFSQYISVTPKQLYEMNPFVIETTGFSREDSNLGRLTLYIQPVDSTVQTAIIATKTEIDAISRNFKQMVIVDYTRDFAAPIEAGEEFGTLTYVPDDGNPVEFKLIASRSIALRENAPKSIEQIEAETFADPNPFPPITLEFIITSLFPVFVLIAFIIVVTKLLKKRRIKLSKMPKEIRRRFR